MRLNRAGEIDYYEELGVERNAPPEQIRDAFRALVRLLHPDQQTDEHLRSIAEMQMRKVNRIYSVLSDPERRRRYDELLDEDFAPTIVFNPGTTNITSKALKTRAVWVGAAMISLAAIIWFATDPPGGPSFGPAERVSVAPRTAAGPPALPQPSPNDAASGSAATPDEVTRLRSELRAARLERDEAKREVIRLHAENRPPDRAGERAPEPRASGLSDEAALTSTSTSIADLAPPRLAPPRLTGASAANPVANLAVRTRLPGSDPHQFAGFWFFARGKEPRNKNLYPPEFIEAVLTEQNGVVHGKYRSRYQIVDRAISPDVNFEFTGSPSAAVITCIWTGQGGAKGQVTVHMTDENSIKVDWTATEMGSVQGLASGTATLTRRLE